MKALPSSMPPAAKSAVIVGGTVAGMGGVAASIKIGKAVGEQVVRTFFPDNSSSDSTSVSVSPVAPPNSPPAASEASTSSSASSPSPTSPSLGPDSWPNQSPLETCDTSPLENLVSGLVDLNFYLVLLLLLILYLFVVTIIVPRFFNKIFQGNLPSPSTSTAKDLTSNLKIGEEKAYLISRFLSLIKKLTADLMLFNKKLESISPLATITIFFMSIILVLQIVNWGATYFLNAYLEEFIQTHLEIKKAFIFILTTSKTSPLHLPLKGKFSKYKYQPFLVYNRINATDRTNVSISPVSLTNSEYKDYESYENFFKDEDVNLSQKSLDTVKVETAKKETRGKEQLPSCFKLAKDFYLANSTLEFCHDLKSFYWYKQDSQL